LYGANRVLTNACDQERFGVHSPKAKSGRFEVKDKPKLLSVDFLANNAGRVVHLPNCAEIILLGVIARPRFTTL
jgi:hypothetical protein